MLYVSNMQKLAFLIMPFGKEFESVYTKILRPPLEASGYIIERADSLKDRSNILKKIMVGMRKADVVIADLTDNNANVFYELGICHAKLKNVIMITQNIEGVPFDLKQYVLESYSKDIDDVEKFQIMLKDLLESMETESVQFENPVTDFWPDGIENTELNIVSLERALEDMTLRSDEEEETYEDGILDVRMRLEVASEAMKDTMGSLPDVFSKFTENIKKHSSDMEKAGRAKSTVLIHRAINESADTLIDFSREVHMINNTLTAQTDEFNGSLLKLRELIPVVEPGEEAAAGELLAVIQSAVEGATGFHDSLLSTRAMNMSKAFNRASDKAISEMKTQIAILNSIKETICRLFDDLCG